MRASIQHKKKTLKTYEGILKQPNIRNADNEVVKKCELCFKLFANQEYLITHYKKRHLDFYTKQIRPQEDSLLKQELGEYVQDLTKQASQADQEVMLEQLKTEVVDRFNQNLLSLQQEVAAIRTHETNSINTLVQQTQSSLPKQADKITSALKEYEQLLGGLKQNLSGELQERQQELTKTIEQSIQGYLDHESQAHVLDAKRRLEYMQQQEEKQRHFEEMVRATFDQKLGTLRQALDSKNQQIAELQKHTME